MSDFAMDALVVTGEADVFKDASGSDGYLFIQSGGSELLLSLPLLRTLQVRLIALPLQVEISRSHSRNLKNLQNISSHFRFFVHSAITYEHNHTHAYSLDKKTEMHNQTS